MTNKFMEQTEGYMGEEVTLSFESEDQKRNYLKELEYEMMHQYHGNYFGASIEE